MTSKSEKKVSIIIPCFNEKETLISLIDKIQQSLNFHGYNFYEILIVDDFSTDGSKELIEKNFLSKKNFKTFFHNENTIHEISVSTEDHENVFFFSKFLIAIYVITSLYKSAQKVPVLHGHNHNLRQYILILIHLLDFYLLTIYII